MPDLSYPVGKFEMPSSVAPEDRQRWISDIAELPVHFRAAVKNLDDPRLDTPYRPGGWTVRQVVHHVFDSHANAYIRTKLALTEDRPVLRPYDQNEWVKLPDYGMPIGGTLTLIEGLHDRWTSLLRILQPEQCARRLFHPESGEHDVNWLIALYSWHGRHHTAHITALRQRMGW
jgi:hypothetical protein